ncbi:MAG: hypothetical protein ACR2P9_06390 [Gammaproteobacteria bacterium]
MLKNKHDPLYAEFRDYISLDSVKCAYDTLIGATAAIPQFLCEPLPHKKPTDKPYKRTVNLYSLSQNQLPFAFIINKKHLLFYLRKPAVCSKLWKLDNLKSQFSDVNKSDAKKAEEWQIRVRNRADANNIVEKILNVWHE